MLLFLAELPEKFHAFDFLIDETFRLLSQATTVISAEKCLCRLRKWRSFAPQYKIMLNIYILVRRKDGFVV